MGMEKLVVCDGFAVKPRIRFTDEQIINLYDSGNWIEVKRSTMAMSLFLQETALRGILWHPAGGNISAAMTTENIECALMGMADALVVVQKALESGDWSVLNGQPIQSTPYVRKP